MRNEKGGPKAASLTNNGELTSEKLHWNYLPAAAPLARPFEAISPAAILSLIHIYLGRSLHFPDDRLSVAAADHSSRSIGRIHKVGWATPATTDRVGAQHAVLCRRVPAQVVLVHQKHVAFFTRSHRQMGLRSRPVSYTHLDVYKRQVDV